MASIVGVDYNRVVDLVAQNRGMSNLELGDLIERTLHPQPAEEFPPEEGAMVVTPGPIPGDEVAPAYEVSSDGASDVACKISLSDRIKMVWQRICALVTDCKLAVARLLASKAQLPERLSQIKRFEWYRTQLGRSAPSYIRKMIDEHHSFAVFCARLRKTFEGVTQLSEAESEAVRQRYERVISRDIQDRILSIEREILHAVGDEMSPIIREMAFFRACQAYIDAADVNCHAMVMRALEEQDGENFQNEMAPSPVVRR